MHRVWYHQYSGLFVEPDFASVRNQYHRGYHFGEWFTAVHFWNKGYKVLIEKYVFRKHRKSFETATGLLGKDGMSFLAANIRSVAPPDLLVFDPALRFYFFAEIKRERDRIRPVQRDFFREIEKRLCCQVLVVSLKAG